MKKNLYCQIMRYCSHFFSSYCKNNRPSSILQQIISVSVLSAFMVLTSCKTYHMSPTSFKELVAEMDSTKLRLVTSESPMGRDQYLATSVQDIRCVNKKGEPRLLDMSPSLEVRLTYGVKNKRTVFYFDRICVLDGKLVGLQSRILEKMRTIPLDSITKVEVQDAHKSFYYLPMVSSDTGATQYLYSEKE